MPKKSQVEISERVGIRLSSHEKICAERMKTLSKEISEMRQDIKALRADMNKGKGAVNVLIFLAGLVVAVAGYFKLNG
jgi:hypothetical protein|tara:strand:- start:1068 stop:1301 length:234 start_codon:yes stop_codon:yes gene_type:complete